MAGQMKMTEQMIFLAGMGGAKTQKATEEAWLSGHRRLEADKEFDRIRRRAIVRRVIRALTGRKKSGKAFYAPAPEGSGGRPAAALDSIVGIVDSAGKNISPLPALNRRIRAVWRRWFLCDDIEAFPILNVRLGPGGWYLMGGPAALIVAEVLRAKKYKTARVLPVSVEDRQGQEEEGGCCAAEPKIAS